MTPGVQNWAWEPIPQQLTSLEGLLSQRKGLLSQNTRTMSILSNGETSPISWYKFSLSKPVHTSVSTFPYHHIVSWPSSHKVTHRAPGSVSLPWNTNIQLTEVPIKISKFSQRLTLRRCIKDHDKSGLSVSASDHLTRKYVTGMVTVHSRFNPTGWFHLKHSWSFILVQECYVKRYVPQKTS